MSKRAFVTGKAGFTGSYLVDGLVNGGFEVAVHGKDGINKPQRMLMP